jgi:hypothetical protein
VQAQFRGAGHVAHQIPHAGNERTDDEKPAAQVVEPMLGARKLFFIKREPLSIFTDHKVA